MSHHLDTPEAAERGQLFIDDLFVFEGEGTTVFVLDVNSTVTGDHASPDLWPGARYEVKVHAAGAAREALTFRLVPGEAGADGAQPIRLEALVGDAAADDAADGTVVVEGRTGEEASADGVRLWAGRARDPFYFDLSLLEPVSAAVRGGTAPDLSGWDPTSAENTFGGTTVASIVLEVPHGYAGMAELAAGASVQVWAATKLSDGSGGWRQVNRGGLPMIWPIFYPDDTDFSNPANRRHPSEDVAAETDGLARTVAASAAAAGAVEGPEAHGRAVADALLPDVLTYEIGTPARFDVEVRNGRSFVHDAPEAMLSLVTGTAIRSGLTADAAADARSATFPYVVPA